MSEVEAIKEPAADHSPTCRTDAGDTDNVALPQPPRVGHGLKWHQVSMRMGVLRMTMLLESCARGEEALVKTELARIKALGQEAMDAELAATDDWASSSPLHWAAYAGSAACVHMLIDAGAKPTITNKRDASQPLHLAARYGQQAAAVALLERDADVNAINARGNSALHESCANSEGAEVVRTLLRWRTNLEVYNDPENGERMMTPLQVAAESGALASMRQLLQRGANPQAYVLGSSVNPDGSTSKKKPMDVSKLMARNVMQAVRDAKRRKDDLSSTLTSTVGNISSSVGACKSSDFGLSRSSRRSARKKKKPVGRGQLGGSAAVQPADAATEEATPARRATKFQWASVAHRALDARMRAAQRSPRHNGDGPDDAAALPEQRPGEPQIKLQAVHVALAKGNMLCVAELLEWLWRAKGQVGRESLVAETLEPVLAFSKLCEVWLSGKQPGIRESARLLGLIVLSCKHVELSVTQAAARLALGKTVIGKPLPLTQPRNPVLLALKFSVMARLEAQRHKVAGWRQKAARLIMLAALFESLSLALLEGVKMAIYQMQQSHDSTWVSSSKVPYQPAAVLSFWLSSATPYAATKGCRLFSSSSLVHAHVKSLFLPGVEVQAALAHAAAHEDAAERTWLSTLGRWLQLGAVNLAWLPLLTVVHETRVLKRSQKQRLAMQRGDQTTLVIAWLLPCGRAVLRCASTSTLVVLLTVRVPSVTSVSKYDVALALWAAALLESICTQMWHQGRCGSKASTALRGWIEDNTFNTLEIATLALLIGLGICTAYDLLASRAEPSEVGVALQSFAVLVSCMRVLEVSYIFPKAGPQLLTVQMLIVDLWHMCSSLLVPMVLSIACAFFVMKQSIAKDVDDTEGHIDGYLDVLRRLIGSTINSEPEDMQELPLDPYSERTVVVSAFLLTALFGLLVILLLLSMIIARFSLTVSTIDNSIDAIYKLKFAQMTVLYTARLRSSQLAPQPFNLLRRAMLVAYALTEVRQRVQDLGEIVGEMHAGLVVVHSSIAQTLQSTFQDAPAGTAAPAANPNRAPSPSCANPGAGANSGANSGAPGDQMMPPPPGRLLTRRMSAAQDLDLAAQRVGGAHEIDMAVEVERFVQRATCHANIFPEVLAEQCAMQEHRIVEEAGRSPMQVTMEQFAEAARVAAKREQDAKVIENRLAKQLDGLRLQLERLANA